MRVLIPRKGIIDPEAERARLAKKEAGVIIDLDKVQGQLATMRLTGKVPKAVVKKTEERAASLEDQKTKLQEQLEKLENLD